MFTVPIDPAGEVAVSCVEEETETLEAGTLPKSTEVVLEA
jgi:hypothetical protein